MFGWRSQEHFEVNEKKKVNVHINGDFEHGKVIYIEPDWMHLDFLNAASQRLELAQTATRIFNSNGVEIDDCIMLEDDDIVFISNGTDFILPASTNNDADTDGNRFPSLVGNYKVGSMLGRGGFGEVRSGEHQLTGEKVALKFLRKSEISSIHAAERTITEIQCLTALKHNNIISLYQHMDSPHHIILVFEVMEGGDLLNYMYRNGHVAPQEAALSEDEAKYVFHQIISGITFAHSQHICHRDLKLENILLKENSLAVVKIADFGLSDFFRPGSLTKSSAGTLSFLAPEVFRGTSNAGPPLDVWALGVILFAILCGRLPFDGQDRSGKKSRDAVIRSKILKGSYRIDDRISSEAKDLVRRLLKLDPSERATLAEVSSHIWLRNASTALSNTLTHQKSQKDSLKKDNSSSSSLSQAIHKMRHVSRVNSKRAESEKDALDHESQDVYADESLETLTTTAIDSLGQNFSEGTADLLKPKNDITKADKSESMIQLTNNISGAIDGVYMSSGDIHFSDHSLGPKVHPDDHRKESDVMRKPSEGLVLTAETSGDIVDDLSSKIRGIAQKQSLGNDAPKPEALKLERLKRSPAPPPVENDDDDDLSVFSYNHTVIDLASLSPAISPRSTKYVSVNRSRVGSRAQSPSRKDRDKESHSPKRNGPRVAVPKSHKRMHPPKPYDSNEPVSNDNHDIDVIISALAEDNITNTPRIKVLDLEQNQNKITSNESSNTRQTEPVMTGLDWHFQPSTRIPEIISSGRMNPEREIISEKHRHSSQENSTVSSHKRSIEFNASTDDLQQLIADISLDGQVSGRQIQRIRLENDDALSREMGRNHHIHTKLTTNIKSNLNSDAQKFNVTSTDPCLLSLSVSTSRPDLEGISSRGNGYEELSNRFQGPGRTKVNKDTELDLLSSSSQLIVSTSNSNSRPMSSNVSTGRRATDGTFLPLASPALRGAAAEVVGGKYHLDTADDYFS